MTDAAPPLPNEAFTEAIPKAFTHPLPNSAATLTFRPIPAGTLRMGARGQGADEEPIHPVSVAAFYLAETSVTQAQFKAWTGSADYADWFAENGERLGLKEPHRNYFEGKDDHPAEQVTWYEAEAFAQWLNERAPQPGGTFQLPTEAQWEHACRAGTDTDYWNGDGEAALALVGWYQGNSGERTHPVKQPPSEAPKHPYGLHDLHGNVWEWCQDIYDPERYRLWLPHAENQVAVRDAGNPERAAACRRAAALMQRFAAGDFQLPDDDGPDLKWVGDEARRIVQNGDKSWQVVEDAVAATYRSQKASHLEEARWPAASRSLAGQLAGIFEGWATSNSGQGDPVRVLRGGSWSNPARFCRSAYRLWGGPGDRLTYLGFRLAWVPRSRFIQAQSSQAPVAERAGVAGTRRDDAAKAAQARGAGVHENRLKKTGA